MASWIESFIRYSEVTYSPEIFRKWAAITTLAGALERKVWLHSRGRDLYPNLYVMLVGAPGVGKGLSIAEADDLWHTLEDHHFAPISTTKASLIDRLNEAERKIMLPGGKLVQFNSLIASIPEFSDFAPLYDPAFMSFLQSVYDGNEASEKRRGAKLDIKIPAPQLSILAGTTPSYLNTFMPEGAWDQGFISRSLMIYSDEATRIQLFDDPLDRTKVFSELKHDLKLIANIYGKMMWSPEAALSMQAWMNEGLVPQPEHRKLLHYNTRRAAHVLKLSMISSIDRGADLVIRPEDFARAKGWLLEAEIQMPKIFSSMASGGDSSSIEETYYHVLNFNKKSGPCPEYRIVGFLRDRVASYMVLKILEIMVKSKLIEVVSVGTNGQNLYKALSKTQ